MVAIGLCVLLGGFSKGISSFTLDNVLSVEIRICFVLVIFGFDVCRKFL